MKRIFLSSFFLVGVLLFTGCFRDKSEEMKDEEQRKLAKYLTDHNITVAPTASGLYFIQVTDTVGISPAVDDVVEFEYTGKLVDGQVFGTTDSSVAKEENIFYKDMVYGPVRLILANSILGLAEGFQLMDEGEKATLILPSDIAYGGNSIGIIEPYSTLIFDVHLLHVITDPASYELIQIRNFLDSNNYVVDPTESGLYYIETVAGDGDLIQDGNMVELYYTGYFLDGRVFDSNVEDTSPLRVNIPNEFLIEGWNEGLTLMSKGSEGVLIVPYDLAYDEKGTNIIGPYMTLVFDLKIEDVH